MKAVIMAGGFGTRLRPLTSGIPKPMVPMVNKPMMEHIVDLLKTHSIVDIVSTLFYQPDAITGYFGDGSAFGIKMQYRKAEADYGTAGSVRNAKDFLNERFLLINTWGRMKKEIILNRFMKLVKVLDLKNAGSCVFPLINDNDK